MNRIFHKKERCGLPDHGGTPHSPDSASASTSALERRLTVPSLMQFAAPSMLMMLFMGLYTVSDTVLVSRMINTDALSALNIICPVINLLVGLGGMLATGGSAVIAATLGAGGTEQARRDFTSLLLAGAGLGVLLAGAGLVFLTPLIRLLGASDVLLAYCRDYLRVLLVFAPAGLLQVLFQNLLVTAGRPGLGMILSISAGGINLFFDWLCMGPLGMGIAGAALGTGAGYLAVAVGGGLFFLFSKGELRFARPALNWRMLLKSVTNGSSELVSQSASALTTFLFNMVMLRMCGEAGVAAVTILIYTQFLLSSLFFGFSMGTAPLISYYYGARNIGSLKKLLRICLILTATASIVVTALSLAFAPTLAGVFASPGSEAYRLAREGFQLFPYGFLFSGFNLFASAAFTALSNGRVSALLSFLRTFGFLSAGILVLPAMMGTAGVFLAVPLAEALSFLFSAGCLLKYRKRYHY